MDPRASDGSEGSIPLCFRQITRVRRDARTGRLHLGPTGDQKLRLERIETLELRSAREPDPVRAGHDGNEANAPDHDPAVIIWEPGYG